MALNGDKKAFSIEDRLKKISDLPEHEHKHDAVYTHTHVDVPKVRERKTFRAQILTYPSLIAKLDRYAEMNGLSRAEAFERAVSDFLERNT